MKALRCAVLVLTSITALPLVLLTLIAWFYCSDYYMLRYFPGFTETMDRYLFCVFPVLAFVAAFFRAIAAAGTFDDSIAENVGKTVGKRTRLVESHEKFSGFAWAAILRLLNETRIEGRRSGAAKSQGRMNALWESVYLNSVAETVEKEQGPMDRKAVFDLPPRPVSMLAAAWFPALALFLMFSSLPATAIDTIAGEPAIFGARFSSAVPGKKQDLVPSEADRSIHRYWTANASEGEIELEIARDFPRAGFYVGFRKLRTPGTPKTLVAVRHGRANYHWVVLAGEDNDLGLETTLIDARGVADDVTIIY